MSYDKQTWTKYDVLKTEQENIAAGAVVTDNRMNHIEDGVNISDKAVTAHVSNDANPHGVTASQVGAYSKTETDSKLTDVGSIISSHVSDKSNPHAVTKSQIGLTNVDNVQQASKSSFDSHAASNSNPHSVTASQTGAYSKAETYGKTEVYSKNELDALITQVKLAMNPIGTVLSTLNSANPSAYIGGTWVRYGQGKTLVGVDESDSVTLMKTADMSGGSVNPSTEHTHMFPKLGVQQTYPMAWGEGNYVSSQIAIKGTSAVAGAATTNGLFTQQNATGGLVNFGDNTNHNNWQPFVTVYFWRRTA